ncbi:MAG: glycosyltransferase family 2 protein [Pseudomonadota bacterium]
MTIVEKSAVDKCARVKCAVAIVVINFRTPDLVKNCLSALGPELEANDARVAVVDNFSNDGSVEKIAEWLTTGELWKSRAMLIRSPQNTGFSGGNNIGIRAFDAAHYLLLNSDALVRPGALKTLIEASARKKDAGIVAPRLEDEDGTPQISCFRFHSPLSEFLGAAETAPLDRLFKFAVVPMPASDNLMTCDWVSFACVLLKREALSDAGAMDDGYFMYFEDADYCRTLKKKGWRIVCEPSARVVHLRGGSSPVKSSMKAKKRPPAYYYAARTRYFRKWYGPLGLYAANLMWLAGRGVARARSLFGKPAPLLCEHQGADQWTNWRAPLGDRRAPG